jgi:hypothetical protein
MKTPYLFASVLFSTALGLIFFGAISGLSRRVLGRLSGGSDEVH